MTKKLSAIAWKYADQLCDDNNYDDEMKPIIRKAYKAGWNNHKSRMQEGQPNKQFNKPSDKLVDDMKILCGIPPHDVGRNYCKGDGYFAKALENKLRKEGCNWNQVLEIAKAEGRKERPSWDR